MPLHSPPRLLQIRRRDFSVKHWLPQWSGYVERTSGDGDDIINATTVAAEPFDIDEASADKTDATENETVWNESSGHETERHSVPEDDPPGHGGCAAGETDGNDNETNQSYNETKANATQNALPGNQSHSETNLNAIQDAPPGNQSHSEMNANATQGAQPGSQSHNKTNVDATQGGPPGNLSHNETYVNVTQSGLPRNHSKTPDEAEPLDMDAVMAERSRVLRGVATGELDREAFHASNRIIERAFSRLLLSCGLGSTA